MIMLMILNKQASRTNTPIKSSIYVKTNCTTYRQTTLFLSFQIYSYTQKCNVRTINLKCMNVHPQIIFFYTTYARKNSEIISSLTFFYSMYPGDNFFTRLLTYFFARAQLMATITGVKKRFKQIHLYGVKCTYCGNIISHQTKYIQDSFQKKKREIQTAICIAFKEKKCDQIFLISAIFLQ